MALPKRFDSRLLQMECTRNERLQDLQNEKESQTSKLSLLTEKTLDLRRIQYRCLKLEQRCPELSSQILLKEDEIQSIEAKNERLNSKLREVTREIYEAEEERNRNRKYYELQRQEMQKFEEEFEQRWSTLRSEVESLEKIVCQLELAVRVVHDTDRCVSRNDGESAFQFDGRIKLVTTERELTSSLSSSHSLRSFLEAQLEKTLISQDEERKKLLNVMQNQIIDFGLLQRENQDLEEKVFEVMRRRDERKKEMEDINTRIAELRDLKSRFALRIIWRVSKKNKR